MSLTTELSLALSTLRQPRSVRIMLYCLLITAALYVLLAALVYKLISAGDFIQTAWLETLAGYGGSFVMLLLGWFFFPATCSAVAGLFVETLADQIETTHYPELPAARHVSLREQIMQALQSLKRALGLNLLCAPLYLIPGINLIVYGLVNGKLLGREYFFGVALRHLPLSECDTLYTAQKSPIFLRGLLISALFVLPGINLFAPVIATALITHFLQCAAGPLRARLAFAPSNVLPNQPNGTGSGTG